jgi:tight adherence protein C
VSLVAAAAVAAAILVAIAPWRVPSRRVAVSVLPLSPQVAAVGGPAWGALVALTALLVHPMLSLALLLWPTCQRWRATAARRRAQHQTALNALPETADLIALGISAGVSVRVAVEQVVQWSDEPFRSVFAGALRRSASGEAFSVALETAATDLDPVARPLVGLLAAAESDGGTLQAGLMRVSDEGRRRRRSAAAVRARRLPVMMLLPLVLCVLPAFVLLAVAPLVLSSLGELNLGL